MVATHTAISNSLPSEKAPERDHSNPPVAFFSSLLDIHDELLTRARRHARETGQPLRAVVEEGLRLVLSKESRSERYVLPDHSHGGSEVHDPISSYTQSELREIIYGQGNRI